MSMWTVLVLLLWIPAFLFTVAMLWPSFEREALPSSHTSMLRVAYVAVAVTTFVILCAVVGPVLTWRALTWSRDPEE